MPGPRSTAQRLLLRTLVFGQVFLLVASLFAPIPVLATDPVDPSAPPESAQPTSEPTPEPTAEPSPSAAPDPTEAPSAEPTPASEPTGEPTTEPTADPTEAPTEAPTPAPTEAPTTAPVTTTQYIVAFDAGTSAAFRLDALAAAGVAVVDSIPALGMYAVAVPDGSTAVADLRAAAGVLRVDLDRVRDAEAVPSDPRFGDQWALERIGWTDVFGNVSPAGSAVVALLDTGVDASHPDLAGQLVAGASMLDGVSATDDPNGHGTWLAGIIAAATDNGTGIAGVGYQGVRVMPVTVLGADGTGQDSDIIEGVVWAVQHGADVINMSFSNPGYSASLQAAIDYAWAHDVVVVAATGNDGSSNVTFPAGDRGVIGVSATDPSDALAPFSNHGADTFLAAPGVDILTTAPGGGSTSISGTSASSAIVAAAAALLRANDPGASNGVIVNRLAESADPAGTAAETGNGRLNLARALASTSSSAIQPEGAAPVGDGGPIVGPYVAAAGEGSASINNVTVVEGTGAGSTTATFTISFARTANGTIAINWATAPNTAVGGASCAVGIDYITASGSATYSGNTSGDTTFNVIVCRDASVEATESFFANLSTLDSGVSFTDSQGVGTITDDDVAANQPPTATNLSAAETYVEDTTLNLVDIVAADVDNATVTATLTLSNTAAGSLTTGTSGAVTSTFSAGVWTASGAIADVNTLLAGVSFVPALNFNANFTITTNVSDGALSVSGSKAVTGTPVNDAPVLDTTKTPTLPTLAEDAGAPSGAVGALVTSLVDFASPAGQADNVTDVDSGALLGIAITAVGSSFTCSYSLNGGATWTSFTAATATSRLLAADADNRLYCQPNPDVNGAFASAVTFRAWDRTSGTDGGTGDTTTTGGSTAFSALTDGVSLTITPVNDAPTATNLSAAETYVEDTTLNLVDIVAADVDNATVTATLTLSNTAAGSLTTGTSGAVTSTFSAGVWTASGAIADVNTLLAGVSFVPALNFNASFTITTSVSDGALSVSGSKAVTGTPVNDAPTATNLSAAETYVEDTTLNLVDIVAADVDNATVTATLTLSNTAAGSLTTGTSGAVTSTFSAGVWTASGAIADVNTLLAGVSFVPALNFNASFTITTSVSDGALSVSGSKAVTGTPVNDAPTATNLSAAETYVEDTTLNLVDIVAADVDNATVTATLTLSNTAAGSLTTGTSGAVTSTFSAGVWTASGAIADVNTLLAGVSFVPALNFNASFTITTSVSDGALSVSGSKAVTGTPVNDAPVVVVSGNFATADEGETRTFAYTVTDVDSVSPTITESCAGDALTISDATANSFACKFLEGPGAATVSVTADDGSASDNIGSDSHIVLIVNKAPTAVLDNDGPVGEGSPATVSFTGQSDPSAVDTAAGFHYAFDCGNGSLAGATYSGSGSTPSTTCTYPDGPATKTVRARIIDEDGGFTEYTTTVTVDNVAPTVTPPDVDAPENQGATEGSARSFAIGSFVDAGASDGPWAVQVNWGDGSAASEFDATTQGSLGNVAHTYADDGLYTVTVYVTDKDTATGNATFSVTVNNVAPTATFGNDGPVNEGSSFHLGLTSPSDPSSVDTAAGFTYAFDCGDGSGYGSFGPTASATCPTTDNGTRSVKGKISDKDGGVTEYTGSVTVNNVAPTATFGNDGPVNEGSSFHLGLTSPSDPSSVDTAAGFTYAFDCGDGSGYGSFGPTASATCPTTDNGTRSVKGKISDKDGGVTEYTGSVTVNNVAPTATFGNDGPVNEGSSFHLGLTSPSDPSSVDTAAGFTYAFDCGDGSGYGSFGPTASATCPTTDNGTRSVKGKISDKDGGVTEYTGSVTVNNVAPTATFGNDGPVNEGSSFHLGLTSPSDPSSVDTAAGFTYAFDCGDGSGYGSFGPTASATCPTTDNGTRSVKGKISDKDGGVTEYTGSVTVNNVAPAVGAVLVTFDPLSHVATATATFNDPGKFDAPFTPTVTWNVAGTVVTVTLTQTNGIGSVTGKIALPTGCYPNLIATVAVKDKDNATGSNSGSLIGSADAYAASFQSPIQDNERNIVKYGNVVPIKVSLTSACTGAAITGATLYVTLTEGLNGEFIDDTNIVAESVSSADNGNLMRPNGAGYIYNLTTKGLTQGKDYAVRIHTVSSNGPVILQAVLQPKK